MNLTEFRLAHNNDPVFKIADQVNELKTKFSIEFKDTFNTKAKLNHAVQKLGDFFYYIFIYNVSARVYGNNLNNSYGYLNCSTINYKKIDKHYRIFLDYLYKNLFIIYPLNGYSPAGKLYFGSFSNIIKPVKIAQEILLDYSNEQLKLFSDYLIGQPALYNNNINSPEFDPEHIIKKWIKIDFKNEAESRLEFGCVEKRRRIRAKGVVGQQNISTTQIDKSINNKPVILDNNSFNKLNNNYSRVYSKLFK